MTARRPQYDAVWSGEKDRRRETFSLTGHLERKSQE